MELISGTSLAGFPELVEGLGADPVRVLEPTGIMVGDCGSDRVFIPLRNAIDAVERAAAITSTSDLGRRLADRQGIEILGPVGMAARTASTFGGALAIFERFMSAYSPGIAVQLEAAAAADTVFLAWRTSALPTSRCPQTAELSLGIALRVLRLLLGQQYQIQAVHLVHQPLTDVVGYQRYFGCPARFGQRDAGLVLATADLDRPLADLAQPGVHNEAMRSLLEAIDDSGTPVAQSVAGLVRPLLPSGTVTIEVIARQFRLHPKALQRKLAAEDTSFSEVVDRVRREIAEHCLRHTSISLQHLFRQLGFSEQSVLTRACQRWFGATPSTHRNTLLTETGR